MVEKKLQAVVLIGGRGNRMDKVTDEIAKPFLPMANIPLFWFSLHTLAQNNINDVIILTNGEYAAEIKKFLKDRPLDTLKIDVVVPKNAEDLCTAEAIKQCSKKIKQDFLVLGGDFVSDIKLQRFIDYHYEKNSSLTCLLSSEACNSTAPGPKELQKYRDYIAINRDNQQIVYLLNEEDVEDDSITFNGSLFERFKNVELSTQYVDCHVYLVSHRLLSLLMKEEEIESFKADFIPYLLNVQNSDDRENLSLFQIADVDLDVRKLLYGVDAEIDMGVRVFGYKASKNDASIIAKCNTLGAYLEASKAILSLNNPILPHLNEKVSYPGVKVHVVRSQIHLSTKIGDKNVSVVKSIVGEKCDIANETKVEESVLLDGAIVGAKTKLKRCIVGRNAKIGDGCQLENCIIAAGFVVNPKNCNTFIMAASEADLETMWTNASIFTRVVASSVRVAETAGTVIKKITAGADLKIVDKGTNDLQTEADRSAQYCIENSLQTKFENKLKIIGEEEITSVVKNVELDVCPEVLKLDQKCSDELRSATFDDLVIWVDPLDGTSEFAQAAKTNSPLLVQVTVLIGIAYKGRSVAGIIHQPFYGEKGRTVWGIVGVGTYGISIPTAPRELTVVTTRSHSTPLVQSALDSLQEKKLLERVDRIGGAGYKVLKCLEGAAAYVFASPGCKKWDTAGPEAVIRAAGGELTDISGRYIKYHADVQQQNTGGVLATAPWVKHSDYVNGIPDDVKSQLPETALSSSL